MSFVHLPGFRVDAIDRFLELLGGLEAFVVAVDAVGRIGEPDAAVGMDHDVVGRVQALAFELVGDDGDGAVVFVADDAAAAVLAGKLAAFEIERVAVAVAGGIAEGGDAAILFDPAHLDVVGDVAPDEVAADAVPRRALGPERAGVEALDGGVADHVAAEAIVERDDVGVGVLNGRGILRVGPVAGRGVGADGLLRGLGGQCLGKQGRGSGGRKGGC